MRPLLSIDKVVLVGFVLVLIIIGVFPSIIAPIVESGMTPVVNRLQEAQLAYSADTTVLDTVHMAATNLIHWLGGA
jgi:NADH:ubiquinone oxidoreductase subunit 4 (subunit M)